MVSSNDKGSLISKEKSTSLPRGADFSSVMTLPSLVSIRIASSDPFPGIRLKAILPLTLSRLIAFLVQDDLPDAAFGVVVTES